jgi:hypothetical protein
MTQNQKLKLFISYSHLNESSIDQFRKHITPLKNNGLFEDWHDRKIIPGQDYQEDIDSNMAAADIICLFLSADFLSSPSCLKERDAAFKLKKDKGTSVIPIILSPCGWQDDGVISPHQALPTDGKAISIYSSADEAWQIVYAGVKLVAEKKNLIKQLKLTNQFSSFLLDTELLSKAHGQKDRIILDDIFVYPELDKYDNLGEKTEENAEQLIKNLCEYSKVLIAGDNQSGKTTLCKKIFSSLRDQNLVPVYISDHDNPQHKGNLSAAISKAYQNQYQNTSINEIDKDLIIPIIDNFHLALAKNKRKWIEDLRFYRHHIITVDDVFSLNFDDENLTSSFTHFKIKEFTPSLRNEVIKKWIHLGKGLHNESETYASLDKITEVVTLSLGTGIMPSYPFFILTIISTQDSLNPLEKEITSQGYCYQALIYIYLRKQGAKNDEIEIYINFLTELAFYFYQEKKRELSPSEFSNFLAKYLSRYVLPIEQESLLENLQKAQIIRLDSCNNYSFFYEYIYYFFTAKYLSEHLESNKAIVDIIIQNLHRDENAYIAIFISHHSKNSYVLDETILNAMCLFDKFKPATLSKEDLAFFDKQSDIIVSATLPLQGTTPERERAKKLQEENHIEKSARSKKGKDVKDEDGFETELRRGIKTVEVMGCIIKNRAGSLERSKLEEIFGEAVKIYLRILTSFLEVIKNEEGEKEIVNFISDRLNKIIEKQAQERRDKGEKEKSWSKEDLDKKAKKIFWHINFFFVHALIGKIINSLGSNKLTKIIETICDKENTPAHFLVKHGISMWYDKNLQTDKIIKRISQDDFSKTAKSAMELMIINHCSMHPIGFDEKQKIAEKVGITLQKLI